MLRLIPESPSWPLVVGQVDQAMSPAVTAPAVNTSGSLSCYYMLRLIPESPSWLLVVGQVDRAMAQLGTVAKINGKGDQVRKHF